MLNVAIAISKIVINALIYGRCLLSFFFYQKIIIYVKEGRVVERGVGMSVGNV